MKKILLISVGLFAFCILEAIPLNSIKLKKPNVNRGSSLMNALKNRKSATEYSDVKLNLADLSDLLWAADGINRPENGKKTAASAMNKQEVCIYTFTEEGVHIYESESHELKPIISGDHRKLFGEGMPPLVLLLVSDVGKFGEMELRKEWGAIDAGLVSQNIALFCAGNNLSTRPRAGMDRKGLTVLLGLTDEQLPMLNHPIGYSKK